LVVGGEADFDGFGTIVFALKERGAAVVANVFALRRLVGDVEDGFAAGAGAASAEARDDFRNGEFVVDDGVEREIFGAKELAKRFGLIKRAGKTVEKKAAGTAEAAGAFANHFPDGRVRDEFAASHVVERGGHGGRGGAVFAGGGGAEDVAGGEMAGAEALMEELGLRAFADAGSAEENESPAGDDGRGSGRALGGRALEPGGAVGLGGHGSLGAAVVSERGSSGSTWRGDAQGKGAQGSGE